MKGKVVKSNFFVDNDSGLMSLNYIIEGHRPSLGILNYTLTGVMIRSMLSSIDIFTSEKMIHADEPISYTEKCGKYIVKSFVSHNLLLKDIDKQKTKVTYYISIYHDYNCPDTSISRPRISISELPGPVHCFGAAI